MKTLYVVRHAKSSWEQSGLEDFERPLNLRGEKDAPTMGKRLHKQDVHVDLVCSSPAKRAMATAQIVSKILGYIPDSIHYEKKLYHANAETILQVLNSFDDNKSCAMIVGHNPGLTEFVNDLLDEDILNIPTAGVVGGQLRIDSWKKAKWKCGELLLFDYPKKNRNE